MSKEFYDLCYDQYKVSMRETDQIYQRVSFVLLVLTILGGITVKLGRIDIFDQLFTRVDVFLYYLSSLISYCMLMISILCVVLFALPRRKKYQNLGSMKAWKEWRDDYDEWLKKDNNDSTALDQVMIKKITKKLADAQANNAPINEKRRQYFHKSVLIASLTMVPIIIQASFYLILKIQGVE